MEDPPKHAVFILATTEINKVPATIISRTQKFDFKKVSVADLGKLLKYVAEDNKVDITQGALQELATAADGSFRDGLSLLDQVINYAEGQVTEELVEQVLGLTGIRTTSRFLDLIIDHKTQEAVGFISELMYAGRDLYQFQKDFLEYLRKILLTKVGVQSDFGFTSDTQDILKRQAEALAIDRLAKIIQLFQKSESEIKWTAIQSLPLELAAVEASASQSQPVAEDFSPPQRNGNLKVSATSNASAPETLNRVVQNWPQILEKIKDYNHSLIASLKLARPEAVEGEELIVVFPYKFHKDAIDARKNRIIVDQVIEEITGLKLMVKPVLQKDAGEKKLETDEAIESALKIMGGEIE